MLSSGPALSSDSDKEGEDEGTEEEELPALPILAKGTKKEPGLWKSGIGSDRNQLVWWLDLLFLGLGIRAV